MALPFLSASLPVGHLTDAFPDLARELRYIIKCLKHLGLNRKSQSADP